MGSITPQIYPVIRPDSLTLQTFLGQGTMPRLYAHYLSPEIWRFWDDAANTALFGYLPDSRMTWKGLDDPRSKLPSGQTPTRPAVPLNFP